MGRRGALLEGQWKATLRVLVTKANTWGGREETPCLFLYPAPPAPHNYGNLDSTRTALLDQCGDRPATATRATKGSLQGCSCAVSWGLDVPCRGFLPLSCKGAA